MNLVKWEPKNVFRAFDEMANEMQRLMPWTFRPTGDGEESITVADWSPAVDIQESEKEYVVKAEIPEVKKEDVKVTVEDGVLTLKGERRREKEEKGEKFHRIERSYGSFLRTFSMPIDADETKVAAEFKNGMLLVHLPKTLLPKPKAVEIKVS